MIDTIFGLPLHWQQHDHGMHDERVDGDTVDEVEHAELSGTWWLAVRTPVTPRT